MTTNSYDVLKILDKIAATSSRTGKEELVAANIDDPMFQAVLKAALDPFVTYGIKPAPVESEGTRHFDLDSRAIWGTLHALSTRTLTGNEAAQTVHEVMDTLAPESSTLLWRILNKDLRCGMTEGTVNRVRPGFIPVFKCMLAHKFEQKRITSWPVYVEPKYDGVRVLCLVKDGAAKFFSRTGKPFPAIEWMGETIAAAVQGALEYQSAHESAVKFQQVRDYLQNGVMLDGEVVSGSFNETVGSVRRKEEEARDAQFLAFDVLPASYFESEEKLCAIPLNKRRGVLERIVDYGKRLPQPNVLKISELYFANSHDEITTLYDDFRARGLEGAMVKPMESGYSKARSHAWLKMKAAETADIIVKDVFEGTGKYEDQLGGIICDYNGVLVRVGGGFTDEERKDYWNNKGLILGRMAEVEYHEETPDGSLRHPRFLRWRDDKHEQEAA